MSSRTPRRAATMAGLAVLPIALLAPFAVAAPASPDPSASPTATAEQTAEPTSAPTPGTTAEPSPDPTTASPDPSASPDPTASPTPSASPSASPTPSASPASPTPSPSTRAKVQAKAAMSSPIAAKYAKMGGASGVLGAPVGAEKVVSSTVRYQDFKGGTIWWTSTRGAVEMHGDVWRRWVSFGRQNGKLGAPIADHQVARQSWARIGLFEHGAIYWTKGRGAKEVHGDIWKKWNSMGRETGTLGAPTTDQQTARNGYGRISLFDHGAVYWSSGRGAKEVHGDIWKRWNALGRETGKMGAPTTDQLTVEWTRVSRFDKGWLVWSTSTGARPVTSLVGEYSKRGGPMGDLGVPISDESTVDGVKRQYFRNARLDLAKGKVQTRVRLNVSIRSAKAADVKYTYRSGCPVGASKLKVVTMNYLGYDYRVHRGVMILRSDAVNRTVKAFESGGWSSFPIYQMKNPDVWKADDPKQMAANNTSAFNCRKVVGNPYAMSPHSYGRAVDINTVQNPYFDGRKWWPSNGKTWIKKRSGKGVLTGKDAMTKGMTSNGYFWGGWWSARDWQHFEIR